MNITERILRAKADYDEVYDAGKQAEYDAFWDSYQTNGGTRSYAYGFAGGMWKAEILIPKYDVITTAANCMFYNNTVADLKGHFERIGKKLDFSQCTIFNSCFSWSKVQYVGVIDTRSCDTITTIMDYAKSMISVDKFILRDDGSQSFSSCFTETVSMKHFIVEGVIGQKGFNVGWSTKLDKESITSIMVALSTTTSGLTVTLSKTAVNNAFGIDVDDPTTYPEGSEWYELRHSRDNWTVAYK